MELTKYGGTEILAHIRHDLRQLPNEKSYGNESVDTTISKKVNTSLINRGTTAEQVNNYRKNFEQKIFKYNRKNLVHAIELVIQCPSDCPQEQENVFFQTAFDWYCDKYLPAGKDCVFIAEIHRDEHKWIKTENGLKDISKPHLHICYVPAIPAGKKHPNFQYRLNADALTKKAILREMHPSLQKILDQKGIHATVYKKKNGNGKTIPLTVKQLKEITNKTGITIDHTLTVEELGTILSQSIDLNHKIDLLMNTISDQKHNIEDLTKIISDKDKQISCLQQTNIHAEKSTNINKENADLQKKLLAYEIENKELKKQLLAIQEQLKEKNAELETTKSTNSKENIWGIDNDWGVPSNWSNNTKSKNHDIEEEKLW